MVAVKKQRPSSTFRLVVYVDVRDEPIRRCLRVQASSPTTDVDELFRNVEVRKNNTCDHHFVFRASQHSERSEQQHYENNK